MPKQSFYYCKHPAQKEKPFKNRIHFDKSDIIINPEWFEKPTYLKGTVFILGQ